MKPNFVVDTDFPLIDGIGHSDKIGFFNVKGGGATNTTLLDPFPAGSHAWECFTIPRGVSTDLDACHVEFDMAYDSGGGIGALDPLCLNAVPVGDLQWTRGSDSILMSSVEISGSVVRPGGAFRYSGTNVLTGYSAFPYVAPKCFVALVLDTQCNGLVPPNATDIWEGGSGFSAVGFPSISCVPMIECYLSSNKRYRVLAFDVLEFDGSVEKSQIAGSIVSAGDVIGGNFTSDPTSIFTDYSWRTDVKGFRFCVDLHDSLCKFVGPAPGDDCTVANVIGNALHLYMLNFDGVRENAFLVTNVAPASFQYLYSTCKSRLIFKDYLSPTAFAPAGADGGVVADEPADALDVLADQSAALAGLPALPESPIRRPKKKTKASEGYYNYRPRDDDALMQFPDDPEVAALPAPGSRGFDYGRLRKMNRIGDYDKPYRDEEYDRVYRPERTRYNFRSGRLRGSKRGKY